MAFFEWADDLVIGEGVIDADHRQLVAIVNELHTATTQGTCQEVVADIIERLIAYTRQYFARKEQIMASAGFPALESHQAQHLQIIREIEALKKKHGDSSIMVASQLSTLLRDWLPAHIRGPTRRCFLFMKNGGRK